MLGKVYMLFNEPFKGLFCDLASARCTQIYADGLLVLVVANGCSRYLKVFKMYTKGNLLTPNVVILFSPACAQLHCCAF